MSPSIENLYQRFQEMFPAGHADHSPGRVEAGEESGEGAEPPEGEEIAAAPQAPCRRTDHARVGYDLDLTVEPHQVLEAAGFLDEQAFAIDMITAVDRPDEIQFELLYDFLHFQYPSRVVVRTRIPRDRPEIPTLSALFPGANWHERETAEFFGVRFTGHPNPIHLLLPDEFQGFPLRKDFKPEPDPS